jgi:hypothetical protein
MSILNGIISAVVAGDDLDITRTVTGVPATQTLSKAWLTFKSLISDADPGLLQKVITSSLVVGQGQITDTGASGTGALLFQLSGANTLTLPIAVDTRYDIKVLTSAGKIYTVEQGLYTSAGRITVATS